jgi:selenide,water dikinase
VVDDPYDFGCIAATNAISDVYAMGGRPIMALALLGMPLDRVPLESAQQIVAGGASICAVAGIPVAGGHSIDSAEPLYGLVVLGLAHPDRIRRNDTAQPGDRIILAKGLGIGIFSAALKRGMLSDEGYATMLRSTTQLNAVGPALAERAEVHAMTDVTGFGLLGHLLEMCRGSSLGAELHMTQVPILPGAAELAQSSVRTGASPRNWASYGAEVRLPEKLQDWQKDLLCDPQTSGGLLIAVAAGAVPSVLALLQDAGFAGAGEIGAFAAGEAHVTVV